MVLIAFFLVSLSQLVYFAKTCAMALGYQAVICGMDPVCCESSSWMDTAQVDKLPRGSNQPFYQVQLTLSLALSFLFCHENVDDIVNDTALYFYCRINCLMK